MFLCVDSAGWVLQWLYHHSKGGRSVACGHRVHYCGARPEAVLWNSTGLEDMGQSSGNMLKQIHRYLHATVIPFATYVHHITYGLSCVLFWTEWSVGDSFGCSRDSYQRGPSSAGIQYSAAAQSPSGAPLPTSLPSVSGKTPPSLNTNCLLFVKELYLNDLFPLTLSFWQEKQDEHLIYVPQGVCLSFIKIIQEVLGSPPDLDLLRLLYNFLLAVHPPTNTYVCHTPSSFYFFLHIGEGPYHCSR